MSLLSSERSVVPKTANGTADTPVRGAQRPRIETSPSGAVSTAGQEAIDLAARAGLHLDPWQQHILRVAMGEKADGDWAASDVTVNLPRQNGKGAVIEARVLWGLFLGGERQILLTAHEFKTAMNAQKRIKALIEGCPDLLKRVKAFPKAPGTEGVVLHDGAELRFIARSRGSGRGFTADCVIFDECMILDEDAMSALAPTTDAVPNSQLWYLGSAGIGHLSVQLARLRRRALDAIASGTPDPTLAYFEWSIEPHVAECAQDCDQHDELDTVASLLKANPAVGYRLQVEKSMNKRLTLGDHLYARERLGVGDYPSDKADTWKVIGEEVWRALADHGADVAGPVAFALDVTPERTFAAIGVSGWSEQNGAIRFVSVADHRPGTGWVAERLVDLVEKHDPCALVIDAGGPAAPLIPAVKRALEKAGIPEDLLIEMTTRQAVAATGQFYDAVAEQSIVHLEEPPLTTALAGADKRAVGDGWCWARRSGDIPVDISPLVGVTHAAWGHAERADAEPERGPKLW